MSYVVTWRDIKTKRMNFNDIKENLAAMKFGATALMQGSSFKLLKNQKGQMHNAVMGIGIAIIMIVMVVVVLFQLKGTITAPTNAADNTTYNEIWTSITGMLGLFPIVILMMIVGLIIGAVAYFGTKKGGD